jgi:hypothetical protein
MPKFEHPAKKQIYRGVFKQTTTAVARASYTKAGHKAATRGYITRYADEEGKKEYEKRKLILLKEGIEKSDESKYPKTPDRQTPIPVGKSGCFLGGFLKNQGIPTEPRKGKNFQKNWAGRISERWEELLDHPLHHHTPKHHYNTVISLQKGEEMELIKAGHDPYLFLKEVAERTMNIYAEKRGWKPDSLGFMGGVHFDKDHIHVHLRMFPNNVDGRPLSLSNDPKNYRDPEKQHRTSWIQASNQAMEEWWRREMPDSKQNPLVQLARKTDMPDPEIPGNLIYLSASRIQHYPFDAANEYLDAVANAAKVIGRIPEKVVIKKPTPLPTIVRRAIALWAYFNPQMEPDLPGTEASDDTKLKMKRASLFARTWNEIGNGNKKTLLQIIPWLESRQEKETKKKTRDQKRTQLREARALQTLAQREYTQSIREAVKGEALPIGESSLKEQIQQAARNPDQTIVDLLDQLEGPGAEELKLEISRLPESEFQRIQDNSNIGWTIILASAEKVEEGLQTDKNVGLTSHIRNWVAKCYKETAKALKDEITEEYPTHLSPTTLSKIRELCAEEHIRLGEDMLPEFGVELAYGYQPFNLSQQVTQEYSQSQIQEILEAAIRIPAIKKNFEKETPGLDKGPLLGPAIEKTRRLAGPELGFSKRKKGKKGPQIG